MMMDGPPALPELDTTQPQLVNKKTCCLLLYDGYMRQPTANEEMPLCM